jgi:starch-binding outer membrane protein, SusD/RagB family
MNIKRIFLYFILISFLLVASCSKVIEIEPVYVKDGSTIFKTLDDYEFALTGSYALFRTVGYYGSGGQTTSTWGNLPDMMSDNLVRTGEDLANWLTQVNFSYTTDEDDLRVAWLAAYSVIAQSNLTLRSIEQFSGANAKRVNRIKGQALAIRAMVHFDLLRFWGESYERNSTAKGIPYKEVVDIEDMPVRLSVKDSYDKIFRDMEAAENLLGDVDRAINPANKKAFIDRVAVRALLARMHLYSKNYVKAEEYATLVISAAPLASMSAFPNIWKDASVAEVLWSVSFNAGEGSPSSGVHNAPSNRNRYRPSAALEATYDQANDVRFSSYFGSRILSGNNRRILTKFFGRGTSVDNLVDWKVIRTGEMYLIRAEARALQGGKEALGLDDLNSLRAARIANYVPEVLAGQALLDAIALERRKELVGEGHRFFDLKRTTKVVDRTPDCGLASTRCTLPATAKEWNWPIPQVEIDANSNIATQQTVGW